MDDLGVPPFMESSTDCFPEVSVNVFNTMDTILKSSSDFRDKAKPGRFLWTRSSCAHNDETAYSSPFVRCSRRLVRIKIEYDIVIYWYRVFSESSDGASRRILDQSLSQPHTAACLPCLPGFWKPKICSENMSAQRLIFASWWDFHFPGNVCSQAVTQTDWPLFHQFQKKLDKSWNNHSRYCIGLFENCSPPNHPESHGFFMFVATFTLNNLKSVI